MPTSRPRPTPSWTRPTPPRRRRNLYRIDSGDRLPEWFYEYLYRVGTGCIAVLSAAAVAGTVGAINDWHFTSGVLFTEGAVIAIVITLGESLRSAVFAKRRETVRKKREGQVVDELLRSLPLAPEPLERLARLAYESPTSAAFNRAAAVLILVVVAPTFLLIALLVRLSSRGPALHASARVGKHGRVFFLYRFRTRSTDIDRQVPISDAEYVHLTEVGRWLRRTALDRLPELFNVLAGDMNLVGPRPDSPETFRRSSEEISNYSARLVIRPGITGPAQIYGARTSWDRLLFDIQYITGRSLLRDVGLLLRALPLMLMQSRRKD